MKKKKTQKRNKRARAKKKIDSITSGEMQKWIQEASYLVAKLPSNTRFYQNFLQMSIFMLSPGPAKKLTNVARGISVKCTLNTVWHISYWLNCMLTQWGIWCIQNIENNKWVLNHFKCKWLVVLQPNTDKTKGDFSPIQQGEGVRNLMFLLGKGQDSFTLAVEALAWDGKVHITPIDSVKELRQNMFGTNKLNNGERYQLIIKPWQHILTVSTPGDF